MTKVCHLIAPVSFGGGEALLLSLLSAANPEFEDVFVLVYSSSKFQEELEERGVVNLALREKEIGHGLSRREMAVDTLGSVLCVPKLKKLVDEVDPDVMHVHGFPSCLLFALSGIGRRIPAVYTHHSIRRMPGALEKNLFGWIYRGFEVITGVSTGVVRSLESAFDFLRGQVLTINNCVSDIFFLNEKRPPSDGKLKGILIGRVVEGKGHRLAIDALGALRGSLHEKVSLVIVGDGPERRSLESYASQKGVAERVAFTGAVGQQRVRELIDECDFGLLPSQMEGFGIAAAECLAGGRPVLALDSETMRDVVGNAGVLVSPSEIHLGYETILSNYDRCADKAKEQAERYRPANARSRYEEVYASLATGGKSSR